MFIFYIILLHNLITSYYIYLIINRLFIRYLRKIISPQCVGYFYCKRKVLDAGYFFIKIVFFSVFSRFKSKNTALIAVFLVCLLTFF